MKGRIGPYRISERIGTGGMGEVFKAFDDRLDRWVAVKRIRPGKEDTDENRERFLREARATAQLNHSSIVHVYDIFRDDDSDCIVMEYVDGRTLQSLLAEGPLDPLRTAELGKEIAAGLAAAHAKNILHRDLKTENIIVTPEGHAKILDFGLAKPLLGSELDSSLTGKGQLVGTSRAMSPEYVGGDEVDHRSDLFALGVLLYETVTGQSPFKAQNTLATLKQVIVHQQPPVHEIKPEVPRDFSHLIDRLLEKSPEDRPQSAQEVANELARITGYYSSSDAIDRSQRSPSDEFSAPEGEWSLSTTMRHPGMRRYWIALGVLVLAALVGAYFLGSRERPTSPSSKGKIRIVLGDFQNLTNDPLLDYSLDIAFRTGLEQSRSIDVVPEGQIRAALARMKRDPTTPIDTELGTEICQREGAQWLVSGGIVKVGPSYSLSAEIIDPENQERFYAAGDTAAKQGDILSVLQRLVRELRTNLGESAAAMERTSMPLEKVTTSDLEALKMYSLGFAAITQSDFRDAISLLTRALERDPQFAMAHAKLGTVYQALQQNEKVIYHFNEALKYTDRLTRSEEIYLEGWMANLRGTPEDMVRAWKLMTTLYPENSSGYHNLGTVYFLYLNDFAEAVPNFRVALKYVEPERRPIVALPLGHCELALGNYDEAASVFKSHRVFDGLTDVYLIQKRYSEAEDTIKMVPGPLDALIERAHYHIDRGQFSQAIPLARSAIDLAEQRGDIAKMLSGHMTLITSLQQSASYSEPKLKLAIEYSIRRAEALLSEQAPATAATPIPFVATLGKMSARYLSVEQSERIYNLIQTQVEARGIGLEASYLRMLEGEILAAKNQREEALAKYQKALGLLESFQVHESLAYVYELSGDINKAIEENLWLEHRHGRAFSECYSMCSVRPRNIGDWNNAVLRLGRLHETTGDPEEAIKYYRDLMESWANGDDTEIRQEVRKRLESLEK